MPPVQGCNTAFLRTIHSCLAVDCRKYGRLDFGIRGDFLLMEQLAGSLLPMLDRTISRRLTSCRKAGITDGTLWKACTASIHLLVATWPDWHYRSRNTAMRKVMR